MNKNIEMQYNRFVELLETLGECMSDYMYFADLKNEIFSTTNKAAKKFAMPSKTFGNMFKVFSTFVHPDDYPILIKKLTDLRMGLHVSNVYEYRWLDAMGNIVWVRGTGKILKGKNGNPDLLVGTISELGKRRKADNISGFRGASELRERLEREKYSEGFIMRIFVRNIYGITVKHSEKGLEAFQQLLANSIRACLGRGQECYYNTMCVFTVFSTSGDADSAFELFKNISDHAAAINAKLDYKYGFKLRVGVLLYDDYSKWSDNTLKLDDTLKKVEFAAAYASSLNSRSCYIFSKEEYERYNKSRSLMNALQLSVENNFAGFELYYQPIINAKDRSLFGCEALLRYKDKKFGTVSPTEFIPLLEESGLIIPIGRWVMKTAAAQCKKWQEKFADMHVNINLSYIQLEREEVLKEILRYFEENDLDNGNVILEFTESGNIMNETIKKYVDVFRSVDIHLALDDFGTGYSNLQYLNTFNVDMIKIERAFVMETNTNKYSYDLIKHIVELAQSVGKKICIEGIETEEELKRMDALSPDYYQGFYFSRPIPAAEFEKKFL